MLFTNHVLRIIATGINIKTGAAFAEGNLVGANDFSILKVHPDSVNGYSFRVLLDGQTKSIEVRTPIK